MQDLLRPFHQELRAALAEKSNIAKYVAKIFERHTAEATSFLEIVEHAEASIALAEKASHLVIVACFKELVGDGGQPELATLVQKTDRAIDFVKYPDLDIDPFLALRSLVVLRREQEPMVFCVFRTGARRGWGRTVCNGFCP